MKEEEEEKKVWTCGEGAEEGEKWRFDVNDGYSVWKSWRWTEML